MPTPNDAAIAAAFTTLLALQGRRVAYRRGAAATEIAAVATQRRLQALDAGGAAIEAHKLYWLARAADLTLDGAAVQPEPGDEIVDGASVYEVLPDDGEHFRAMDPARTLLRIHVRLTEGD